MKTPESSEALMLVRRNGTISCATPLASHWLREHFRTGKDEGRLPLQLRRWLVDPNRKPGRCRPFTNETRHARLVVSLLRDEVDSCFALLFEKHDLDSPRTRLRHYGITKREEEVLALMAAGKTSEDIAQALGISSATVKRHVEHIFDKYNVRTRAAAVSAWHQIRNKPLGTGAVPPDP